MKFSALSSGSSGNAFYIEDEKKNGILIYAGISSKQICERLSLIGKNPEQIKAIFITHEHSDHIKGVDVFSRSFNVPVFATKETIHSSSLIFNKNIKELGKNEEIKISGLKISPFSKSHKAADPVSFLIKDKDNKKILSVITDCGYVCKNIEEAISLSDAIFLESNHDIKMLEDGKYPYFLKQWIRSDVGHLSNMQAALSILEFGNKNMKNLILSHLSENNNTPKHALKTFSLIKERHDLHPQIHVSEREKPTPLFCL